MKNSLFLRFKFWKALLSLSFLEEFSDVLPYRIFGKFKMHIWKMEKIFDFGKSRKFFCCLIPILKFNYQFQFEKEGIYIHQINEYSRKTREDRKDNSLLFISLYRQTKIKLYTRIYQVKNLSKINIYKIVKLFAHNNFLSKSLLSLVALANKKEVLFFSWNSQADQQFSQLNCLAFDFSSSQSVLFFLITPLRRLFETKEIHKNQTFHHWK